ncbi:MAG: hypothetical protein V4864_07750 [Pseudomonadota bacterium]
MKKSFLLAMLAYVVPTFIIGFVWHLVLFKSAYEMLAVYRKDPVIPFGFASMVLQGLVFAWAYPRLFSTARDAWKHGAARSGTVSACLSWSFTTLAVTAKSPMASVPLFFGLETGFTLLQFLVVAPLMALAFRVR